MKRVVFFLVLLALPVRGAFRTGEARNTLFLELGGNAGIYSLNYDRVVFSVTDLHRFGFRVGFSLLPVDTLGAKYPLVFPLTANYLLGRKDSKFEVGVGVTPRVFLSTEGHDSFRGFVGFAGTIGYRLQRFENDFNFRIGFTPLFFKGFTPWFGLSLGRSF